ncbi:hypothetical protein M427DRAFT_408554 [Gonapodya prolifera JEL478]|uniref:Uncharacterized protein n=1 Tax=Gonapodya prolifera (strain JEL478) TaxID=1344416 RepID=A0A139A5X3_GONPJ|nr:hypothetical protein M427DRAFT_408554 [Gonapodya prolifera JEL478]|eukprot:KXS12186.1 hypothetical protein M427DRAFT_408554 [Gonapodya prolifera JEL478]
MQSNPWVVEEDEDTPSRQPSRPTAPVIPKPALSTIGAEASSLESNPWANATTSFHPSPPQSLSELPVTEPAASFADFSNVSANVDTLNLEQNDPWSQQQGERHRAGYSMSDDLAGIGRLENPAVRTPNVSAPPAESRYNDPIQKATLRPHRQRRTLGNYERN